MDIKNSWIIKSPIAHRGLHNEENPENTLGAFKRAIDAGYPIELDVTAIDDGTIVVFHDEKLCRLTSCDGYITSLSKSKLKEYKILKSEYHIPTLSEVLELVEGQVPLLIEIKNSGKVGYAEKNILNLLKEYHGEYAVQSFNPFSILYFKENAPSILRGQLSSFFTGNKDLNSIKKFMLKRMMFNRQTKPDFISYDITNIPNRFLNKYDHLPILGWTVRSQSEYARVANYVDNIIFENFTPEKIR